jgi:hypothetical protein
MSRKKNKNPSSNPSYVKKREKRAKSYVPSITPLDFRMQYYRHPTSPSHTSFAVPVLVVLLGVENPQDSEEEVDDVQIQ